MIDCDQARQDRRQLIQYQLTCAELAEGDRRAGFEVKWECRSWETWQQLEAAYLRDGWEVAPYGREGSLFTTCGYFRRLKTKLV